MSSEEQEHSDDNIRVPDDTDLANAHRLVRAAAGRLIYCDEMGQWLIWNDTNWETNEHVPRRIAAGVSKGVALEAAYNDRGDREMERLIKWSRASAMHGRIEAMLAIAKSLPGMAVPIEKFDAKDHILNCKNGILNLRNGQLSKHDPEEMCSRIAGCEWPLENKEWDKLHEPLEKKTRIDAGMLPRAHYPHQFAAFLRDISKKRHCEADNDENMLKAQSIIGALSYCLEGGNPLAKVLMFLGSARNGKSTLVNLFSRLLGTYSGVMPPSVIASEDGQGSDLSTLSALAGMRGLRFVSASELSDRTKFNGSLIKRFSGGDEISCRHLHRSWFSYRPKFTALFHANSMPSIEKDDEALLARLRLFNFERYYTDEVGAINKFGVEATPPDPALEHKLNNELSSILLLLVSQGGAMIDVADWSSRKANIAAETQQLRGFVRDVTRNVPGELTSVGAFYSRYCEWAEGRGYSPWGQRTIARRMALMGYDRARSKSTRYWRGIQLLPEEAEVEEAE